MHVRDFRLLAYFEAVARAGSVRQAAERLHVSAPVVSTALSELEQMLGCTLLRRDRRGVRLTAAGESVLRHAREMVGSATAAIEAVQERSAEGTVRITLPTELSLGWLPPLLRLFEIEEPRVTPVIHASDEVVDLGRGEFDLGLRVRRADVRDTAEGAFAWFPLLLVAAPAWGKVSGKTIAERLAEVPCIGSVHSGQGIALRVRPARGGAWRSVPVTPRFQVNNKHVAKELARQGFGAALVLSPTAHEHIEAGELIDLGRGWDFGFGAATLSYTDPHPSAAARAFGEFLRREGRPQ